MEVVNMIILLGIVLLFLVAVGMSVDLNSDKRREDCIRHKYWGS